MQRTYSHLTLEHRKDSIRSPYRPFSVFEKVLLGGILVTAIAPYPINTIINLLEIAIIAFVVSSPALSHVVRKNIPFFVLLGYPVLVGQLVGTSGFNQPTTILAFLKICVYLSFIHVLALRCRNLQNRRFFLLYIVLPIALMMCITVYPDLFTDTRFFASWRAYVSLRMADFSRVSDLEGQVLLDAVERDSYNPGLAARPWHIAPWAMCGLIALMTLRIAKQIKWPLSDLALVLLIVTPLFSSQVNALITIFSFIVILIFFTPEIKRHRIGVILIAVAGTVIFTSLLPTFAGRTLTGQQTSLEDLQDTFGTWSSGDLRDLDPRVNMFIQDAEWLSRNPLRLLFGTGWNIILAPTGKPHNLYMGLTVASGLLGLITVFVFIRRQLALQVGQRRRVWQHISTTSKAGLVSLALTGLGDNYLTTWLNIPASFLALWLALCIIAAHPSGEQDDNESPDLNQNVVKFHDY